MGKSEKPEKGDKVSWNWGGGAPAGTVAETKEQGAIEIETQRGNTVKRKADPSNPAVRIERSGNDVVKRSSELTVEEKGGKGNQGGTKRKAKGQGPAGDGNVDGVEVGATDSDEVDEGPHTINKQGKEVKRGGKEANKKQKTAQESSNDDEEGGTQDKEEYEDDEEEEDDVEEGGETPDEDEVDEADEDDENDENEDDGETEESAPDVQVEDKPESATKVSGTPAKDVPGQKSGRPATRGRGQAKK